MGESHLPATKFFSHYLIDKPYETLPTWASIPYFVVSFPVIGLGVLIGFAADELNHGMELTSRLLAGEPPPEPQAGTLLHNESQSAADEPTGLGDDEDASPDDADVDRSADAHQEQSSSGDYFTEDTVPDDAGFSAADDAATSTDAAQTSSGDYFTADTVPDEAGFSPVEPPDASTTQVSGDYFGADTAPESAGASDTGQAGEGSAPTASGDYFTQDTRPDGEGFSDAQQPAAASDTPQTTSGDYFSPQTAPDSGGSSDASQLGSGASDGSGGEL